MAPSPKHLQPSEMSACYEMWQTHMNSLSNSVLLEVIQSTSCFWIMTAGSFLFPLTLNIQYTIQCMMDMSQLTEVGQNIWDKEKKIVAHKWLSVTICFSSPVVKCNLEVVTDHKLWGDSRDAVSDIHLQVCVVDVRFLRLGLCRKWEWGTNGEWWIFNFALT